ncbi:zinc finger MYM-type protein [Trifolium repens]|nr:zinc finger MYM-type protein [Trifolium repens]
MHLVSTTKSLLQQLRNDGWPNLLENVKLFCLKHEIEIPDISAQYVLGRGRSRHMNLLMCYINYICRLAKNFYPHDFTVQEMIHLRLQLRHYMFDIHQHQIFQNIATLSELCKKLTESGKSKNYHLIDRLIRLILTLPVSTATTEIAFSAMGVVKTRLRNKMDDDFLANSLVVYIEKDIAIQFSSDSIMDEFESLGKRRVKFS